jgi:hypothetical protein
MCLNKFLRLIIVTGALVSECAAADVPFLDEARFNMIRPSIFIIEDCEGASAAMSDWIKIATKQYHIEACNLLNEEIASRNSKKMVADQYERTLSLMESDLKRGIIPRWVENIFIVCKDSEVLISFFARNAGWAKTNTGAFGSYDNPAYVLTMDSKNGKILNPENMPRVAHYVNLYNVLDREGIKTDYRQISDCATPLNITTATDAKPNPEQE